MRARAERPPVAWQVCYAAALVTLAGEGAVWGLAASRHGFDPSVSVVAGDRFVDAGATPSPIVVRRHSAGYDGQFYYRIAAAGTDAGPQAAGVRFDHARWRLQRILYPLLARAVAFGRAASVPAAMVAVNAAALFVLVAMAWRLGPAAGLAIAAWPGFLVAITHDTTEILSAALIFTACRAAASGRMWRYAALGALAVLTRETNVLLCAGVALTEVRRGRRVAAALPLAVFGAWQGWLLLAGAPEAGGAPAAHNLGWPFVGVLTRIGESVAAVPGRLAHPGAALEALMTAAACVGLLGFLAVVAPVAARRARTDGVSAGWLLVAALMLCLSAGGPWIDATAFFRAFTECWVVGWLVLAEAGLVPRVWPLLPLVAFWLLMTPVCLSELR